MTELDEEIGAHRLRIVEIKAAIHDLQEELRREGDVVGTLEAVLGREREEEGRQRQEAPRARAPRPAGGGA